MSGNGTALPAPEGWRRRGAAFVVGQAVTVYLVFGLPFYRGAARLGRAAGVAYLVTAAAGLALLAFARWPSSGVPVARHNGLVLPAARSRMVAAVLALVVLDVPVVLAMAGLTGAGYAVPFGVLVLGGALYVAWLRPWADEVALTTYGVRYVHGGRRDTVTWDDVAAVSAVTEAHPRRHGVTVTAPYLCVDGASGKGIKIPKPVLGVDPVVAYWTLRFYAAHPEARDELVDGRALARVARVDLTG
jgi:hypothetical protein